MYCDFGTDAIDAMSQWNHPSPPMIFVSAIIPSDRVRMTLAHELGHLVMHHRPAKDEEGEAKRFAGEFLLPEDEMRVDLQRVDLQSLHALKLKWKVSMRGILVRADRLGMIDKDRYTWLNIQLTKKYGSKQEPTPLPHEEAHLLQSVFRHYIDEVRYSQSDLLDMLDMNASEYDMLLGPNAPKPGSCRGCGSFDALALTPSRLGSLLGDCRPLCTTQLRGPGLAAFEPAAPTEQSRRRLLRRLRLLRLRRGRLAGRLLHDLPAEDVRIAGPFRALA